ncbi:alpha/beta fold hydrolase [Paraburkholderia solisilvae]|uniref:3-oxoadipate enol-lactonase 2 n=1 Tax=Paraburkholderia solisilvae TaxID=624376 RepID=A0A6J5CWS8_9BURK|nr:alpha/beta hydrolase [Paraburkholderia solisilvae]CAB3746630.1 3-oxoadipate enol-lactonase 2 [Paraburkholderia solisilvae]
MPIIRANGIDLNVSIEGNGPPLLLLHGLGDRLQIWEEEVRHFSPFFTTVAFDARGHGASTKPAHYTLQDHIDDVFALADTLGYGEINLIGASMGSYTAQGVATAQPERVHSVALIVPKSHGTTSSSARLLAEHADELANRSFEEKQRFLMDRAFGPYASAELKAACAQRVFSMPLDETGMAAASGALTGFDFRPMLPAIKAHTLVMSGKYDVLNSVQDGRDCAERIPHAEFIEMKRSGHFPNIEEPELYLTVLGEFLSAW